MSTVLIVEDEPKVARFIQRGLDAEGFSTDIAQNGDEAMRLASERNYDVITVDLMLPATDGFSVIEQLRELKSDAGILIVSARDTLEDKLHGFRIGSDDYIQKPFAFEELVARINVILRRKESSLKQIQRLQYADLELDLSSRRVLRGDRKIELTNTEFRLLEYLVRNAEHACSRADIAKHVWKEEFDRETNIVDVYMMYVRKKVNAPNEPQLLQTVRGVGYMIRIPDERTR